MPAERLELETALERFDRLLLDTCVLIDDACPEEVPIVTSNVRDFKDVAGLRYVAW